MSHRPPSTVSAENGDDPVGQLFDAPVDGDPETPVLAAGALCWRPGADGGLELLLVRSARWGDWSWPKGKLDAGESLPECAVREVAEETGLRIELGVPLPPVSYVMPDGRAKTVHYWAARVRGGTLRTSPDEEITDVTWLPVAQARDRLSRPGDLPPAEELLALAEQGRLDTRPLLVLRHAKARSRAHWSGEEADRPLTHAGRRQARNLTGLLACWEPERMLSSPWARCMQTLQPYLDHGGPQGGTVTQPEVASLLSEQGLHDDPDRIGETVAELLDGRLGALICTHRPVLEVVVAALGLAATPDVQDELPDGDPWLSPAEILVVHVSDHKEAHSVIRRIHSVERYRGETVRTRRA